MAIDDGDMGAALQRVLDRFEIQDLVARYGMAVDDRDLDTLADLFTVEGAFRHADGAVDVTGRDEVVAFYRRQLGRTGPSYHYPSSHLVEFAGGDEATGVVNAHAEMAIDGTTVVAAIRYEDRYRREDGRWRFVERRLQFLYMMPLADLPHELGGRLRCRWPPPSRPAQLPESLESWRRFYDEAEG